jgi:hypothetical protein
MKEIRNRYDLLNNDKDIIRVPFLIKGTIVSPPEIRRETIESAFLSGNTDRTYIRLPEAQIIRERVIDRKTMRYTGEYLYSVMPVFEAEEIIETDTGKLADGLYSLSVEAILNYLERIMDILLTDFTCVLEVMETWRLTSEYPDSFIEQWFAAIKSVFSKEEARQMINNELSFGGKPGGLFLDGWTETDSRAMIRAMPTRQLHITAGNVPEVPLLSMVRAILTKSCAAVKLPYGAVLPGALFALAAASVPDHPITKNLSIVYWQGGDDDIENRLFTSGAFDRIIVWGSPEAVTSVQSRALFTRVVTLNPRYGVSLIGKEAFSSLDETAALAATDMMIYDQKACTSSLVHYVEGTEEQANEYAEAIREALSRWDSDAPGFITPSALGRIKRLQRGKYIDAGWHLNTREGNFSSGVVVVPGEFDILDHPMSRLVVVRPVSSLEDALNYLSSYVSMAGVYPEKRRLELRDRILSGGISNVLPLGSCDQTWAGMPHDDMLVLSELVDWKNG